MAYRDLREFIELLEKKGLLQRISTPVDPNYEITEITDRVTKAGGPALLFEQVKGSSIPLVINLFGTMERMNLALEVEKTDEIAERIRKLMKLETPTSLLDKLMMLPKLHEISQFVPQIVKDAPCKALIRKAKTIAQEKIAVGASVGAAVRERASELSLSDFPILKCWPQDGGKFITFPLVITRDPKTGMRNVGIYRMQVYDDQTTGMHWQIHKHGARHEEKSGESGQRQEVAVALGGDPATMFSAAAPLPEGIDEFLFAGFLRRKPVELVKCETVDLEVPAHAEIILEGYVDPTERRIEGPFGDHTGFYSLEEDYPVFHLTCITQRKDPIYPTTLVGKPIQEDYFMGKAVERIFLPLIQTMLPEVVDMNFPAEGVFHNCVVVSIKKSYPGHAKKIMHAFWGMGQLMFTKLIVVVDHWVDIQNLSHLAWYVLNNIDARRDVVMVDGPVDALDHASPQPKYGAKMGLDLTRKGIEEGMSRPWPDPIESNQETKQRVTERWKEYGF